ncbi:Nucleoid-associated protein YgaU, contains BON and LysM domains [Rhizobium mongolense subsp. loessense]|uniref:Nucleoid-associated protein YgaU, contains BON and LysM domains n=1 Tax=Rhizobium mongolense subsp. loessense TaxID=158890 RepID=A0A1G4PA72_9HYPH|nr:LysM peptidoglycan-binding domain-containing protein [Rhizobium mongolense]SCW29213.1 Nucleoid-associated protein YgaU, contains BON and LysM domains [Rhizobium mongolense subsp. loessense]
MMRNRAGLLAFAVLAVAILLMVFVVMPRIGEDPSKIGDAINQAGSEVKNTVEEAGKSARNAAADTAATTEKLGRLSADAGQSLTQLKALFADGKGPTTEAFDAAKTKAAGSLKALADFAVPEGTDPATATAATKAKDGAAKALAIVQALPENIADALAAINKAEAELSGKMGSQPAASPPATDANIGSKLPAFDVLRVEPDGSTVIAGSATPNSKLEVMDGDKVVTTTNVGPTGDFAAVLDNPLPPGDHQLVLKVTGQDGKSLTSEEVATVSVPKDGSGSELLAMVSKPGAASRIITAPTAGTPAAQPAAGEQASAQPGLPAGSPEIANTAPTVPGAPQAGESDAASSAPAEVMVNAVEIEGKKIFVAGTAKPNANVIAYADDALIGKATAGADGHFVIDGVMDLSVGDHKIRVDVVDGSGKVLIRASVNFTRPAGDQVTVAAQPGNPSATDAGAAMVPLDEGELGKLRADAGKAFGLLKGLFADGKLPGAEQLAAARSATEFALRSIAEFRPAAEATPAFKQTAGAASQSASSALAMLQALPKDTKSVGDALGKLGTAIDGLAATPAQPKAAGAPASNEAAADASQPKTIEQAPLTANNTAVIIRRGDTLWQISRRVYGLGVRYTTIYMANETQINNPDRILPGQIFGLPKEALPNAEELHRKRLSGEHL